VSNKRKRNTVNIK